MKAEILRIAKGIHTYKDLCSLLNAASEDGKFNMITVIGLIAETNEAFCISNTSELSHDKYQDYAHMFLCMLHDLYSDKSDEFLRRRR